MIRLLPLVVILFSQSVCAEDQKKVDNTPRLAYGLMIKSGDKTVFAPCRDQSYITVVDASPDMAVTKALNTLGLEGGKKIYAELMSVLEGGVLKTLDINLAKMDGRCQLPGTSEEAWRAAGNDSEWLMAAGGDLVILKQPGKPDIKVPYAPFKTSGKLATFDGSGDAGVLNIRLENTLCQDPENNAIFGWTATISTSNRLLKGCAWAR